MKTCIGLLMGLLITQWVAAEPEVIADFGGQPTGLISPANQLNAIARKQPPTKTLINKPVTDLFPVQSKMQLGVIETHAHDKPVNRAFFIIGADEQSAQWLATNQKYLIEINARGLVTNVNSEQELNTLREYGSSLPLDAIPVDAIAAVFDLDFYPVLVTKEEVMQ